MPRQKDFFLSLFRLLTVWSWILLLSGGFLFLLRRVQDGFAPQDWQLPVLGGFGCLLSAILYPVVRALFSHSFSNQVRFGILAWVAALLYLGSLYTPQNAALIFLVCFVFSVVHSAIWFWSWDLNIPQEDSSPAPTALGPLTEMSNPAPGKEKAQIINEETCEETCEEESLDFPDDTLAHWTRQTVPATAHEPQLETLSGWFRVCFVSGQQTETVNIPFVPPFRQSPETNCYPLQGVDVKLEIAQNSPHGTRVELKLARPVNHSHDIIVELTAQGEPVQFSN